MEESPLRLLGPLDPGVDSNLSSQGRLLLALLALEPRPHPRSRLAALMWPDHDAGAARRNLRFVVHGLKKALGGDALVATRDTLAFNPTAGVTIDATELLDSPDACAKCPPDELCAGCAQRLESLCADHRGELLEELVPASREVSDWLEEHRERLLERRLALLERLRGHHERHGRPRLALRYAREALELAPLDEEARQDHARLTATTGSPRAALAGLRFHARRLEEEIHARPSTETLALAERLRRETASSGPERRQLTVLVAEWLLASDLDPEHAADQLARVREPCVERLRQAGAVAYPTAGTGLVAYFGASGPDEHAAVRAVRAGLELLDARPSDVCVQLGVDTGLALMVSESAPDAAGQLTMQAGRLGRLARDTLVLSDATRRIVEASVHTRALPSGSAWSAVSEKPSRPTAKGLLVGRADELASLERRWREAVDGQGSAVLLQAEPGLGKSRLAAELLERAAAEGIGRLWCCAPDSVLTPFAPFLAWLDAQPPASTREALVERLLSGALGPAPERPTLVVVEDLHWADPSTLELLGRCLAAPPTRRLLVLTARPSFAAPWAIPTLTPAPLRAEDATRLVQALGADGRVEDIVRAADGVPLFLEALTNLVSEGGRLDRVPSTLRDLLQSRVSRAGSAATFAKAASVIGRHFDEPLLARITGAAASEVRTAIAGLERAGLVRADEPGWSFRHALVQEAAYDTLTLTDRGTLHARVAQVLKDRGQPEQRARHLEAAGDKQAALEAWTEAGRRAVEAGANQEAVAHLRKALALLHHQPPSARRDAVELRLQMALGAPLTSTRGYGSAEAEAAFTRALELSRTASPDDPLTSDALRGVWLGLGSRADHTASYELALKLLEASDRTGDAYRRFFARYALGQASFWLGRFEEARNWFEQALALPMANAHETLVALHAEDSRINALSMLAWTLYFLDRLPEAWTRCDEAMRLAEETNHPYGRVTAKVGLATLARFAHDTNRCLAMAEEIRQESATHGFMLWEASGLSLGGWARALEGDPSGAEAVEAGLELARRSMPAVQSFYFAMLAEIRLAHGRFEEARALVEEARRTGRAIGEGYYEAALTQLAERAEAARVPSAKLSGS